MNKAKELALKLIIPKQVDNIEELCRFYYIKGYHQATKDICEWLKDNLYDELAEDLKKYLSSQT